MKKRMLRDIEVSALGMGCMGFSTAYGKIPEESESIRLMHKAHEMGCTFYDTAEIYATFRNRSHFTKLFTAKYKCSPSSWKQQFN